MHNHSNIRTNLSKFWTYYFEEINYGATIRFGFDKFSIFGKYRLSDMFTQEFKRDITTSELPRLEIGLQYSIYLD